MTDDLDLAAGDVVRMRSCRTIRRDDDGTSAMELTYRAPKGTDFVFVLLGTGERASDFDTAKALVRILECSGWIVQPPRR